LLDLLNDSATFKKNVEELLIDIAKVIPQLAQPRIAG
jgi:hypothetical protein